MKKIFLKLTMAAGCASVIALAVFAGSGIHADATAAEEVCLQEQHHDDRIMARTIEGEISSEEWDWELSASERESVF